MLMAFACLNLAGTLQAAGPNFDWSHVRGCAHTANGWADFTDLQIQWLAQNNDIVTINPNQNHADYSTVGRSRLRATPPGCARSIPPARSCFT